MYYPSSENKGADQLRGYREADLRLCFRICRLLVFPRGGSYELCHEKTGFLQMQKQRRRSNLCLGFRPDLTKTNLFSDGRRLEIQNV